ncbi:AsmA family protein [Flavobacteriaceae bacterium D16]|nr:AsmA family protein [Flavobacteriaceae bacterium D16]
MKKKLLIVIASILVVFFAALILLPLFFEAKIATLLKENVNKQIEGEFDFDQASLSLIASFPKAKLSLEGSHLIAPEPFVGDTLFYAGALSLEMAISELFKGLDDTITIENITVDRARLNLKVNADDSTNYDIASNTPGKNESQEESTPFSFSLKTYAIKDSEIAYHSSPSKIDLKIFLEDHKGSGDLSLDNSKLDTQTKGLLSFELDSVAYLKDIPFELKALIGMDLKQNRYQLLENQALLMNLALVFEGEVLVNEDHQEIDIRFDAPAADFKDFIAIMPEAIVQDMDRVNASGKLAVSGTIKGISSEESIPGFDVQLKTENATVQYADLPRTIDNIVLDVGLVNSSGKVSGTRLEIKQSSFAIAQDQFQLKGTISDIMGDKQVGMEAQTRMDLARLGEAYPLPAEMNLSGKLNADFRASFTVKALEAQEYNRIKMDGAIDLRDFVYNNPELNAPLILKNLKVKLDNDRTIIQEGNGTVGQSDFQLSGSLQHLAGYALGKQDLQGSLNLRSDTFLVSDFMGPEEPNVQETTPDSTAALKIPTDLDLEFNTVAGKIVYNDLELKDFKGKIRVQNGAIDFDEVTTGFFEGQLALKGSLNTLTEQPEFAVTLDMESLQIQKAFEAMELLQVVAPVAGALKGKFSSQVELAGKLTNSYTPELATLTGAVLAEILTADVQSGELPVLTELNSSFDFFDTNKLDLRGLKTALAFENGKVRVKPFNIKYDDILIKVAGGHGFDRSLDYQLTLDVPAKYLGKEVQGMVAALEEDDLKELSIPVQIGLGGTHTSPRISSDLSSGVKSLTNNLLELQKQKLINKGSDQAKSLIGGLLGKKSDSADLDKGDNTLDNVLKDLTTQPQDSLGKDSLKKESNPLEEKATGLLKNLLKGKKKDTSKTGSKQSN